MIDWAQYQSQLITESEPLVRGLLAKHRESGDELVAIGYVFEFGRGQLEFDLCANTARNLDESLRAFVPDYPDEPPDEVR